VSAADSDAVTDCDGVHSADPSLARRLRKEEEGGSDSGGEYGAEEGHDGENAAWSGWFVDVSRRIVGGGLDVAIVGSEIVERLVVPASAILGAEDMPRCVEALHLAFVVGVLRRCSVSKYVRVELPRPRAISRPQLRV
jgi:hypothetical protein